MPVHRITPEEAVHLLAHDDVDLVDVREPHEWASGHIPGARHLPLGLLLRDPQGGLRRGRERAIFVCAHGIRSLTAAAAASQRGLREGLQPRRRRGRLDRRRAAHRAGIGAAVQPRSAPQASASQPARKSSPPTGVTAPSPFTPVSTSA